MTTAALNNLWAYINGLTLTANEKQWLADKLTDKDSKIKKRTVSVKKEGLTGLQWLLDHPIDVQAWNKQAAWNSLSAENQAAAGRLNLTPDDMDERTFSILSK